MKLLVLLSVVGLAICEPYGPVGTVTSQYHAQDELGQYSYGYSGGPSAKQETRTLDGVTRGGYSYVDGHGLVQSASYVADAHNGFRVAATNLPVGPAVPAGPAVVAAAAPAVVAAPAVAAAPAVVAAPAVAAAHSVLAAPAVAGVVAAGHGSIATRVATPLTNTLTVTNVGPLAYGSSPLAYGSSPLAYGHGLWGGLGLLRHKRSLAWAAPAVATLGHAAVLATPQYVGPWASHPVETLAPTGHDTLAVSAAKAAHAAAVHQTATRDALINSHVVAPVVASPALGLWGHGLLRHRRSIAPLATLGHAAVVATPWASHPVETLAPTGHDTIAVSAAKAAHAAAVHQTAARDALINRAAIVSAAPIVAPAVAAAPVVAAQRILAAPAVAPVVAAAPAISSVYAAAPAVVAAPLATSTSVVSTAPGAVATRVITPTSDVATWNNAVNGHWGTGLWGGLLRHKRSLGWAPAVSTYVSAPIVAAPASVAVNPIPASVVASTYSGLPGTPLNTPAVAIARAEHNLAWAQTAARDSVHSHIWG